ncbi:Lineage-specific thermal regulator protein, partial [Dysosmobacter welbionis]
GGGGPDHGDEALEDHHIVEGHAALPLALHGAGDDSGLRGVEAGENAAGHGDEEDGDEVVGVKVLTIAEGRLLTGGCINSPRVERDAMPVIPQVQQGIALDEQADEHTHGGEQQDGA